MRLFLILTIVAAATATPFMAAAHDSSCGAAYESGGPTDEDAIPIMPQGVAPTLVHVDVDGASSQVWQETNGVVGLQKAERMHHHVGGGAGCESRQYYPADTRVA